MLVHVRRSLLFVSQVRNLSGGELQRVAITLALGTPADIYLIDEPSAYLDSEQRIIAAKVHAPAYSSALICMASFELAAMLCVSICKFHFRPAQTTTCR